MRMRLCAYVQPSYGCACPTSASFAVSVGPTLFYACAKHLAAVVTEMQRSFTGSVINVVAMSDNLRESKLYNHAEGR